MATTIKLKNGSGAPAASDLVQGEPAIDLTNKRLYTENASGVVIEVGSNPSSLSINGTAVTATAAEINTLDGITSSTAELNILDGVTSTAAELNILDGVTSTTAELNILDGVTSTTAELNILDGVTSTTAELNILDGVTATASELNILDGVTSTTAELNILDGVTSTAVELNILDGVTSTTAELNILDGVTATAAELNVLDGVTAFVDEDNMSSNSATSIPSQQSVKAYVDSQVTAQDLDFQADSGGALSIDLDSETLTFTGGTGIDTSGSGNAVTFAVDSTVATLAGSQTLTNKTLTSPDINTPDIDGGTIDGTVIGGSSAAAGTFSALVANSLTYPTSDGNNGQAIITNGNGTLSFGDVSGGGGITYVTKTANYTMSAGEGVIANTAGGTFTITLPASPSTGDQVIIADGSNWATTNLTVGRNGSTIEGVSSDLVMDVSGISVTMVYDGSTWQLYPQTGTSPSLGIDDNADSVAITINSSEQVGIGTTSPSKLLETVATNSGGDTTNLQVRNNASAASTSSSIRFVNSTSGTSTAGGAELSAVRNASDGGALVLKTATNGTASLAERMRIHDNGDVSIGTSSTFGKLRVDDSSWSSGSPYGTVVYISGGDVLDANWGHLMITQSGTTTGSGGKITFGSNGDNPIAGIKAYYAGGTYGHLDFYTRPSGGTATQRVRIDSVGNLVVGSDSAAWGSTAKNVIRPGGDNYYIKPTGCASFNRTASDGEVLLFYRNGTYVGNISITSSATSFNSVSDYRLKENVAALTGATDRLKQLPVHRFNFISTPDVAVDGFLAHEVSDIVPEAVLGTKDETKTEEYEVTPAVMDDDGNVVTAAVMGTREVPVYQGIDQSKLVPLLTAALQEAVTRIETLEAEVTALQGAN